MKKSQTAMPVIPQFVCSFLTDYEQTWQATA